MNYSSVEFLLLFPAFAALYWLITSHAARLVLLLGGSLLFYAYGSAAGLPILLAVILITWATGLAIARWDRYADLLAPAGVTLLVINLGVFKYATFVQTLLPTDALELPRLVVPLGISFFTFEAIAYLIDLKRGMTDVERSPLKVALYIAFFPHLIAGPIMRADDLIPQLGRKVRWDGARIGSGLQLLVEGLVKKRLLADPIGIIVDGVFAHPEAASTPAAWLGVLGYTVQIYADFSGYTDMARGLSRILGLELPSNFNLPYAAHSVSDFWQRWHITLSSWLRDYLWVPLGGLRQGRYRPYVTVFLTMLLGGVWHGAGWNFVVWGAYQGAWLALERKWHWFDRIPRWLAIAATLFLVMNGWVLFRSQTFEGATALWQALYGLRAGTDVGARDALYVLAAFGAVIATMAIVRVKPALAAAARHGRPETWLAYGIAALLALVVAPTSAAPFIYFRF